MRECVVLLQAKLERIEADSEVRDEHIRRWAKRRAHRVMLTTVLLTTVILVVPGALKIVDPDAVAHLPSWLAIVFSVTAVIMVVLTVAARFVGGTVLDWLRPIERRLANRAERGLRASAGLPLLQHDEQATQPPPRVP